MEEILICWIKGIKNKLCSNKDGGDFGYTYLIKSTVETVIEENKSAYYISLRTTQKTFSDIPDYTAWLTFFLQCLKRQKIRLENKINKQNVSNNFNLPLLASKILSQFNEKTYGQPQNCLKF